VHEPQSGEIGMHPHTSAFGGRQLAGRGEHCCVSTMPLSSSQYSRPVLHIALGPQGNVGGFPPLLDEAVLDPLLLVEAALDPLVLVEAALDALALVDPPPDPVLLAEAAVDPAPGPVGPALLVEAAVDPPPAPVVPVAAELATLLPQDAMAVPAKRRVMKRMGPS
jgi:hypothetical protein